MPHTKDVEGFIEKLGDFYELVDDDTSTSPVPRLIKAQKRGAKMPNGLSNGGVPHSSGNQSNGIPDESSSDSEASSEGASRNGSPEHSNGTILTVHILFHYLA